MYNDLQNFWEETISNLTSYGLTWEDVLYVQNGNYRITKNNFKEIAKKTNYDSGYGRQMILSGLVLIGKGWWMAREEYDGSEWWGFYTMPEKAERVVRIDSFLSTY